MEFRFTDEQQLFRHTVHDFLSKECTSSVVRNAWYNNSGRTENIWEKLADIGVLGITAPENLGGLSMSEIELILLLEEAGHAALPEPLLETVALAIPLLLECENRALKEKWLGQLISGKSCATVGVSQTPYISYAKQVNLVILQQENELRAFTQNELQLTSQKSVDTSRKLYSIKCISGAGELVAEGKRSQAIIARAFNRGALGTSAFQLGLTQAMIDMTVEYVKSREQFGKPIGSFQAIKHMITNALLELEFAKPMVYRAAYSLAHNHPDSDSHVSMAKVYSNNAAYQASTICLQAHGAMGYSFEHDLHLWMKRCWSLNNAWGNSIWHRNRIGKAILD